MNIINFPKQKPTMDQLELARAKLSAAASEVSKCAMTAQLEILSAESTEEFAAAISKFHGALAEHSAGWAVLADQSRHWSR